MVSTLFVAFIPKPVRAPTLIHTQGISPRPPTGHGHASSLPPATRRRPSTPAMNGTNGASSGSAGMATSSVLSSISIGLAAGGGTGPDGQKRDRVD